MNSDDFSAYEDNDDWADLHGYVRIYCKKHGHSWSDGGICEECFEDQVAEEEQYEADKYEPEEE